jgi:hypothetical protein
MIEFNEDKQNRKLGDLLKREEEELVQLLSAKYVIIDKKEKEIKAKEIYLAEREGSIQSSMRI